MEKPEAEAESSEDEVADSLIISDVFVDTGLPAQPPRSRKGRIKAFVTKHLINPVMRTVKHGTKLSPYTIMAKPKEAKKYLRSGEHKSFPRHTDKVEARKRSRPRGFETSPPVVPWIMERSPESISTRATSSLDLREYDERDEEMASVSLDLHGEERVLKAILSDPRDEDCGLDSTAPLFGKWYSLTERSESDLTVPASDIFLSHSDAQRVFVEQLWRELEKANISIAGLGEGSVESKDICAGISKGKTNLPVAGSLPLRDCKVAVVVLSEEYLRSKRHMMELSEIVRFKNSTNSELAILPLFFNILPFFERVKLGESDDAEIKDYFSDWEKFGESSETLEEWLGALRTISNFKGLHYSDGGGLQTYIDVVLDRIRLLLLRESSEDLRPIDLDEDDTHPSDKFGSENRMYDVHLSFRGSDVRPWVGHLAESLGTAGVRIFYDNQQLEKGGSSSVILERIIDGSIIHIPIFSRNYAGSAWCLKEVTQMLRSGRLIIPLYYDVEPADVHDPETGVYAEAFKIHGGQGKYSEETILEWKKALKKLPSVSQRPIQRMPGHEGDLVRSVVRNVLRYLQLVPPQIKYTVGLEKRMDNVFDLLDVGRDDRVIKVVIWGMGGLGKSTLALAVCNTILDKFEASSFIYDVRTRAQEMNGLCQLQRQMLRDLSQIDFHVRSLDHGKALMRAHLQSIPALVILDGVDQQRQLDALLGDWFGNGSRIIVTTRDMGILKVTAAVKMYPMAPLNNDEALRLFSWHAFGRALPDEGYESLSQKVVDACGGLPLSLKVIGSFLHGQRDVTRWIQCSMGLESCAMWADRVFKTLKVSYDSLSYQEKQMFLDVACFFIPEGNLETAKIFWESLRFPAEAALSNLIAKSLLSVNDENQLLMHNHLQYMGRALVDEESKAPGERSRLWRADDAVEVIEKSLGTESVRGISISRSEKNNIILRTECLSSMPNLHLLWLDGPASIEGDLRKMPPNLRWLRWSSCPWECLPPEWNMEHLSVLDLRSGGQGFLSSIKELWNESSQERMLECLQVMQLNWCEYLERLPDFSNYSSLLILDLEHCSKLKMLPDSIGLLLQLEYLNLSGCKSLEELPDSINKLTSLERLFLRNCFSIRRFPNALGELETLKELDIRCLRLIQELPSFHNLPCLEKLDLSDCHILRRLPVSTGKLQRLQYLNMNGCRSLSCLPEDFGNLGSLKKLFMNDCCRLSELPLSFGKLVNLRDLEMKYNSNLMGFPASFNGLTSLVQLDASDCNLLDGLPEQVGGLSSLEILTLENNLFRSLPSSISNLAKLTKLNLNMCETLLELPALPEGLVELDIGDCMQLKTICDMSHLEKLKSLVMCNCEHLVRLPQFCSGQSLRFLNISRCKNVRSLGDVEGLKSLQTLYLSGSGVSILELCQWMKDMPDLQELSIHSNRVPECLEHKMQKQFLKDNVLKDLFPSPMEKIDKCKGVILCCVLKFLYKNNGVGLVSEEPMEMSIVSQDGQELFNAKVFSNRQRIKGDQLYVCIYRENHPLIMRLESADSICVWLKGSNIQVRDGGMQLLYENNACNNNGTVDAFESLGMDLSLLEESYNENAGRDEFDRGKDELQYRGEQDSDDGSHEHDMSEDEYQTDEE